MNGSALIHAIHHSGSGILKLLFHEHQLFIQSHEFCLGRLLAAPAGTFRLCDTGIILLILQDLSLFFLQGMGNGLDAGSDMLRVHLFGIDLLF